MSIEAESNNETTIPTEEMQETKESSITPIQVEQDIQILAASKKELKKVDYSKDINITHINHDKGGLMKYVPSNVEEALKYFQNIAETICTTSMAQNFKTTKVVDGENVSSVNPDDIVAALIVGYECGFTIGETLSYGRNLDKNALMKIQKGKTLGLSRYASLDGIYVIPSNGRDTTVIGVHILNKLCNENGVQVEYIAKFKLMPIYYLLDGTHYGYDESIESDDKVLIMPITDFYAMNINDVFAIQKAKSKTVVIKDMTPTTIVKLTRNVGGVLREGTERFSIREAIEAGLYRGFTITKEAVKGKSNWNCYPAKHVDHRARAFAARDVIADVLASAGTIYVEGEIE